MINKEVFDQFVGHVIRIYLYAIDKYGDQDLISHAVGFFSYEIEKDGFITLKAGNASFYASQSQIDFDGFDRINIVRI